MGLAFHGRFPERVKRIVFQALGLSVLTIGLQMALKMDRPLVVVFSMVLGGITGELCAWKSASRPWGSA